MNEPLFSQPVIEAAAEPREVRLERRDAEARKGGGMWLALWLLLIVAAAAGGYYLWQQQRHLRLEGAAQRQDLTERLQTLQHRVDELGPLSQHVTDQDSALANLQSRQQALEESQDKLRNDLTGSARLWDVEQVAVLLQIANDRLRLEDEVGPSLAALQAADRHLQQLKNPTLLEVRRQLAKEIATLESASKPDVPGMAFKLEALINGIDRLPVVTGQTIDTAAPAAEPVTGWRGMLHDLWEDIKGLVVIKHRGRADRPLLAPDEHYFLYQNLRLQLEAARIALLRRDSRSYRDGLRQAREWIGQYFDDQAPAVAATLDELTRLQQVDIAPPLPDISASLDTLEGWLAQRKQEKPAGATAP
jgi:uroporphyrin-3 C-methyltransferase